MSRKLVTEVDLESMQLNEKIPDSLKKEFEIITQEDYVETPTGSIKIQIQGELNKPAIFTYHDIGLNALSSFGGFFNYPDMAPILKKFTVFHINAPGQEENARTLSQTNYTYPNMDQLADMVWYIMKFYKVERFIGFGSGAGANILCRFALDHPRSVEALVIINCTASKPGWTEWAYQKMNLYQLFKGNLTEGVEEYLLWHWFGNKTVDTNYDLVKAYSQYIKQINPYNLGYFIDAYLKRTDLGIIRETNPSKKKDARMIQCPTMLITGDYSPHLDDTIDMNSRMDPGETSWIKFECGGLVMEEQPAKFTESFRLFLQGMGYVVSLNSTRISEEKKSLLYRKFPNSIKLDEINIECVEFVSANSPKN